jgi:hypothetical protein
MSSPELALHPNTLVWRLGASPVGLLAYLSLYWFASDPIRADQERVERTDSQPVNCLDEAQQARNAM